MKVTPILVDKIIPGRDKDIFKILTKHVENPAEKNILAISSKIVAICEGRIVKIGTCSKIDLIKQEADFFIPPEKSKFNITLTIKNSELLPTAGIDESNGNGYFILWPKDPYKSARLIEKFLKQKFNLKNFGVIITDSKSIPLKRGIVGFCLGFSGFKALNNYIGKNDIFGRKLQVTQANVAEGLAAAAVAVMGEGKEQTPLVLISEIPFVKFRSGLPSDADLQDLKIGLTEDLFGPMLQSVSWKKGRLD